MRKMKSRILAAILAAGMIFTAQGMTALAGTTGVGAAKTGQSTGGPGETVKDVENASADNENAGSGEQEKYPAVIMQVPQTRLPPTIRYR